jgi:hypothetical protein
VPDVFLTSSKHASTDGVFIAKLTLGCIDVSCTVGMMLGLVHLHREACCSILTFLCRLWEPKLMSSCSQETVHQVRVQCFKLLMWTTKWTALETKCDICVQEQWQGSGFLFIRLAA